MYGRTPLPNDAHPYSASNLAPWMEDYRVRQIIYTQKQTLASLPVNTNFPW